MKIFIPTRGRLDRQETLIKGLFNGVVPYEIVMVVPFCERKEWQSKITEFPEHVTMDIIPDHFGISDIRQHILDSHQDEQYHFVIDDDLSFNRRASGTSLKPCSLGDILAMLEWIEETLEKTIYKHGGISARVYNNAVENAYTTNTKIFTNHFYDSHVVRSAGMDFTQVTVGQDVHMTLTLLRAGYPNVKNYEFAYTHHQGHGSEGGCTRYRTVQMMNEDAKKLAEIHKGYITLREKPTKYKNMRGAMILAKMVRWKKAYQDAKEQGLPK